MNKTNNKDCIFCKIIAGEILCEKIFENDNFIVFNDIKPVSPGHRLIIPKVHYETLLDMPNTLGTELLMIAKKQGLRLMKEKKADGFKLVNNNFEASGQVVKHFHLHVIPEKLGVRRERHV